MSQSPTVVSLFLASPDETTQLGNWLAANLRPGDTVLLSGPIGSGKTHLARATIQSWLGRAEDVPSPTFTLVQTYEKDGAELWHADLYRLTHPDEAAELGLDDAFGQAICIIEWPDQLGSHTPASALRLHFAQDGEGRRVSLDGGPEWAARLAPLGSAAHV